MLLLTVVGALEGVVVGACVGCVGVLVGETVGEVGAMVGEGVGSDTKM